MRTAKGFKELGMKSMRYTGETLSSPKDVEINSNSLTELEQIALDSLRKNEEGMIDDKWATVYLDNALPDDWSGKTWSGVLSSLSKKGYYQDYEGDYTAFGMVRMS